jgi:uncharacterized protein YfdQ (DUF2303 family)
MSNDNTNHIAAALEAGAGLSAMKAAELDNLKNAFPYVLVPEGYSFEGKEEILPAPLRKRGMTTLHDAVSFISVVNDQKGAGTRLYSTINPPTFHAVFNDHADEPGWRDHAARYNAPLSPEWKTWTGMSGRHQTQTDFAQFIETNLPDIATPLGAVVLEVARTLEAKKKVNFASSVRLSDGSTQFTYEEDVQGSAQKGQLQVPEVFVLAIPVFENGELWKVEAQLRYRIADGGKLTIWYELVRPHKVIEAAVKELRATIAAETGLPILVGSPS